MLKIEYSPLYATYKNGIGTENLESGYTSECTTWTLRSALDKVFENIEGDYISKIGLEEVNPDTHILHFNTLMDINIKEELDYIKKIPFDLDLAYYELTINWISEPVRTLKVGDKMYVHIPKDSNGNFLFHYWKKKKHSRTRYEQCLTTARFFLKILLKQESYLVLPNKNKEMVLMALSKTYIENLK